MRERLAVEGGKGKEGRGEQAEETDTEREGAAEAIERGAPSPCVVEP